MTTNVVVKVYENANWDAEVYNLDHAYPRQETDKPTRITLAGTVKPGGEQTFYCTDTRDVLVKERKHG